MSNKVAAIVGLVAGIALLLYWGGEAPPWLLKLECLVVLLAALAFGFTANSPKAPEWLRHDAVRGLALIYLGIGAAFVPANLLLASFLIGSGCKLVSRSGVQVIVRVAGEPPASSTEILVRPKDEIRCR